MNTLYVRAGEHLRRYLHYGAFYRFDAAGTLVSERMVMNWAPLASGGTSTL